MGLIDLVCKKQASFVNKVELLKLDASKSEQLLIEKSSLHGLKQQLKREACVARTSAELAKLRATWQQRALHGEEDLRLEARHMEATLLWQVFLMRVAEDLLVRFSLEDCPGAASPVEQLASSLVRHVYRITYGCGAACCTEGELRAFVDSGDGSSAAT
eukprot:gene7965-9464_t